MSVVSNLLQVLGALPDDAQVSVGWIREHLQAGPVEDDRALADLTAEEGGHAVGRAASTIRNWCSAGVFPGAYKLNDREWRIPRDAMREYMARQRGGDGVGPVRALPQERALGRSGRRRHLQLK